MMSPTIASTEGAALAFKGVALRTLILPQVTMLDFRTLAALRAFAKGGGRIVAVGTSMIETPDGQTVDIRELPNAMFVESVEHLVRFA